MKKIEILGKKIKEKREEKGMSLDKLVEELSSKGYEINKSSLSRMETSDKQKVDSLLLVALSNIFNYNFFEILGLESKGNAKILLNENFIEMPVRAKASAGNGYINLEECIYSIKVKKNGYHKDCYVIEVVGSSMEPLIDDGAFVIVDPLQTQYIKDKVYIVRYNEEIYVKKVEIDEKSNFMVLKSVNPHFENVYIAGEESLNVKILGRAIKFYHEGNL